MSLYAGRCGEAKTHKSTFLGNENGSMLSYVTQCLMGVNFSIKVKYDLIVILLLRNIRRIILAEKKGGVKQGRKRGIAMTEKELRRLGRGDLLSLLLEESRENQRLRELLLSAQDALADNPLCMR